MTIILGEVPDRLTLNLSADSPFATSMQRADGVVWDVGTLIELRVGTTAQVGTTIWVATIDGFDASWTLSASEVNTLIDFRHAALWFNGKLWAVGSVVLNA